MPYNEQLQQLRTIIPIGLQEALALLKLHDGNVEQAADQYQQQLIRQFSVANEISHEKAVTWLQINDYDIGRAQAAFYRHTSSVAELILQRNGNLFERIGDLAIAIEHKHRIHRTFWLTQAQFDQLPNVLEDWMKCHEWLVYKNWETYLHAIRLPWIDQVIQIISNTFSLPHIAEILQQSLDFEKTFSDSFDRQLSDFERHIQQSNAIDHHEQFVSLKNQFTLHELQLHENMLFYVQQHLDAFP